MSDCLTDCQWKETVPPTLFVGRRRLDAGDRTLTMLEEDSGQGEERREFLDVEMHGTRGARMLF